VSSIWVHRDHQICTCHRISAYRELEHQVGGAKWRYRDPRYPDKIITVDRGDTCQGIPIIGVRRIGVLDDREHLHVGFAIRDIPR
jgi:hypothetical protein